MRLGTTTKLRLLLLSYPGAKKNLAGVAVGVGIAVLVVNILSWLWSS